MKLLWTIFEVVKKRIMQRVSTARTRKTYGWFAFSDTASVFCERQKDMTLHELIGKPHDGLWKCLECGQKKPARVVNWQCPKPINELLVKFELRV